MKVSTTESRLGGKGTHRGDKGIEESEYRKKQRTNQDRKRVIQKHKQESEEKKEAQKWRTWGRGAEEGVISKEKRKGKKEGPR